MQLDRLRLDLRPRPHPQALDLGMALLRAHAADTYRAWLALWLPLCALMMLASWVAPHWAGLFLMLPWWVRPLLERAPLYVLSREVFGEHVGWRAALRAWPRELGGGWIRMLTWWRPFMSGRGLYQPVWQLERARGAAASQRLRILARNGTGFAAWSFGGVCATFETVLTFGALALAALFVSDESTVNPFALFFNVTGERVLVLQLMISGAYALAVGVIGPVYVACTFALYLNRRANLEAWDIEITLRQIRPPMAVRPAAAPLATPSLVAALLCAVCLWMPAPRVQAADCKPPEVLQSRQPQRGPDQDDAQRRTRAEVDALFASQDLRGYECIDTWRLKDPAKPQVNKKEVPLKIPEWVALSVEAGLIGAALLLVGWFVWRYRDRFTWTGERKAVATATEVAGLDITEESLPDDVPAHARALWARGEQRAALALLYRATLSRLVYQHGVEVHAGATEGDCLRLARAAHAGQRLGGDALHTTAGLTTLWLAAAYGDRWPASATFEQQCAAWSTTFSEVPA